MISTSRVIAKIVKIILCIFSAIYTSYEAMFKHTDQFVKFGSLEQSFFWNRNTYLVSLVKLDFLSDVVYHIPQKLCLWGFTDFA